MESNIDVANRIEHLEAELGALRRSNRTFKLVFGVAAIACLAFTALPQARSATTLGTVRAQRFVLVNAAGQVRATLGNFPALNGTGYGLVFYDTKGKQTLGLGNQTKNGAVTLAGLGLYDGNQVQSGKGAPRGGIYMDGTIVNLYAADANGTSTGVSDNDDPAYNFAGFYANDSNNANRTVAGLKLDGSLSVLAATDPNGVQAGVVDNEGTDFVGTYANDATGFTRADAGINLAATASFVGVTDTNGTRADLVDDQNSKVAGLVMDDLNQVNRRWDLLTLDGTGNDFGMNDSNGKTDVLASESGGTGSITTSTNGTETGHLP